MTKTLMEYSDSNQRPRALPGDERSSHRQTFDFSGSKIQRLGDLCVAVVHRNFKKLRPGDLRGLSMEICLDLLARVIKGGDLDWNSANVFLATDHEEIIRCISELNLYAAFPIARTSCRNSM